MRQVVVTEPGGPEVLELRHAEAPRPGGGELAVAVDAAGVSLPVVRQVRAGGITPPYTPGGEVVGRVVALGDGVTGLAVGERVAGLAFGGAYAEVAVVPAAMASRVPDRVDDDAAVCLVRGGQVALGVVRASGLQSGERVLVTSAASGVGHLAVQLARLGGAGHVVAAVGVTSGRAGLLLELGADAVVGYDEPADRWDGPFDVVLDGTGGEVQTTALGLLAPWGRLVSYNACGVLVDVNLLRLHARSVIGFAMAPLARHRPELYRRRRDELWRYRLDGDLRTEVHPFPLEQAVEAHRLVESRTALGRVILRPG